MKPISRVGKGARFAQCPPEAHGRLHAPAVGTELGRATDQSGRRFSGGSYVAPACPSLRLAAAHVLERAPRACGAPYDDPPQWPRSCSWRPCAATPHGQPVGRLAQTPEDIRRPARCKIHGCSRAALSPVLLLEQKAGHCVPGTRKKDGWLSRRRREDDHNLRAGTSTKAPAGGVSAAMPGRQNRQHRAPPVRSAAQGRISQITACDPCMRFGKLRSRFYATMRSDAARQGSDAAKGNAPLAGVADWSSFDQWPPQPMKARRRTGSGRLQTEGFSCRISFSNFSL
jgi:hypothetical protein